MAEDVRAGIGQNDRAGHAWYYSQKEHGDKRKDKKCGNHPIVAEYLFHSANFWHGLLRSCDGPVTQRLALIEKSKMQILLALRIYD
jgi:hypothetical protein